MEHKREKKEKDTLLEMGNLNSDSDVGNSVQNKIQGETNKLTEDGTTGDTDDNENTSAIDTEVCYEDSSDSSSEEDEHSHVLDPDSCKGKIATMMKSNVMQYCVIAMVIVDCLIIVLELLIDMGFIVFPEEGPSNSHHQTDASHHPVAFASANFTTEHPDYESYHDHNTSVYNSSHHDNSSHLGHHDAHHHTAKEKAEHILHALSLTILSLFMIEVSLKIYVEGKHLLRQKAEVFDAVVVIVSFTLDIVFSFVSVESAAKDAAGLMVLLRLWRVTRIINGVILSVKIEAKKKSDALKKIIRQLEHDNRKQRSKIDKLEKENSFLRQQLTEQNDGSKGRTNALVPNKVSHGHHHHHHDHTNHNHNGSHRHKTAHKDHHGHKKDHQDSHGHKGVHKGSHGHKESHEDVPENKGDHTVSHDNKGDNTESYDHNKNEKDSHASHKGLHFFHRKGNTIYTPKH